MKNALILLSTILFSVVCSAQSSELESAFWRIENGLQNRNVGAFEDLITSSTTVQFDTKVYRSISSIETIKLLKEYLLSKDSVAFAFTHTQFGYASGRIIFWTGGAKTSTYVDVFLRRQGKDLSIGRINFTDAIITY